MMSIETWQSANDVQKQTPSLNMHDHYFEYDLFTTYSGFKS